MWEVTYTLETKNGMKKAKRVFHDKDIADSEATFQPGMKLNNGDMIREVSVKKTK